MNAGYKKIASESSSIMNEKEYQILNSSVEGSFKSSLMDKNNLMSLLNKPKEKKSEINVAEVYKSEEKPLTKREDKYKDNKSISDKEKHDGKSSDIVFKSKKGPVTNQTNINDLSCENILKITNNSNFEKEKENGEIDLNTSKLKTPTNQNKSDQSSVSESDSSVEELENMNNDAKSTNLKKNKFNDDVMKTLMMREQDKKKSTKRRMSNLYNRKSNHNGDSADYNPGAVSALIKKVETGTEYGKMKQYLKIIDCIIALIVCLNIVISIIDNEIYLYHSDIYFKNFTDFYNITTVNVTILSEIANREITAFENTLRFTNIVVVSTNLVFISFHYIYKLKLLQADRKLSEYDNIFSSGLYKPLFLEILSCAFFMPPYANYVYTGYMMDLIYCYNLNAIISFFVLLKCYIILRVYSYFSRWTSDTANSICMKYKVRTGIHFAIKAELKKRPYTVLIILMIVVLTLCSIGVRTFEYSLKDPSSPIEVNSELQSLANCFWLTIITMMTVGYGDFFPKSHFGRAVTVVACIIGMLLVSLIVVSLAVVSEFSAEEKKAYLIIKKHQAEDQANNKATEIIKTFLKIRLLVVNKEKGLKVFSNSRKFYESKLKSNFSAINAIFIFLTQLKRTITIFKSEYRIANSYSLPIDEMLKRLETKLKNDISLLSTNINKINIVDEHLESLASVQHLVHEKMQIIVNRQRKIADYLVKINNENYNALFAKLLEDSRKNSTISETIKYQKSGIKTKEDNDNQKDTNNDKISEDHSSFNIYSNNADSQSEGEAEIDQRILLTHKLMTSNQNKNTIEEIPSQPINHKYNLNSIYFDNQEHMK
jgi:hypothetical protein